MQEDKDGTIRALSDFSVVIAATAGMTRDLVADDEARMKKAAGEGYATATDLADWLVRTLKMPFREAHHVTGRIVGKASEAGTFALHQLPLAEMQAVEPRITEAVFFDVLSVAKFGEEPDELWRHRAEKRPRAGQALAQEAGCERRNAVIAGPINRPRFEPRFSVSGARSVWWAGAIPLTGRSIAWFRWPISCRRARARRLRRKSPDRWPATSRHAKRALRRIR